MPEQRWQTFLDELLFFPPGKQFGSSQPSRNNSSHQSQTPSGSYVAPPSTVSISSSHQSPTPFGSHSAPTPTMSIDTSQTPSGRYLFGSGRPSQTPFGGRLAPTVSISSSHQSQTSFGSPTPTVSSHQSQTPSGHSLFGSVRPSQTPFGGHLAPTSTMSISSSHQSQTSFGSPTPTVSIDTGNQSQTLSGGYLYPPSTMSISQTPFASQWSHQSQTSVVRDPQAPSRRTARKQFIDSATGYHRPQMAHDQQSSATGKGSVKYLTCHYYNQGHCRFSAKKCLYSHCQTGKVANAPRQAIAGGPVLAGQNLDRALVEMTRNKALENENHFLRQAIQAFLAITDRSTVATEELQQGFDNFQHGVDEVITSWGGHSAEWLLLDEMVIESAKAGWKAKKQISEANRELAEWKAHYTNSAI